MIFDKANILVVDDDQELSEFLTELLMKDGYKVSAVMSVNDAIQRLKNDIFDFVLLDLKLPEIGGVEGIKMIKKVSPHSKIIVITGYSSVDSVVSIMKDGAIDYLKKPFDNEELLTLIRNNIRVGLKDNVPAKLGDRIRAIRKEKGIKIKQLSARSSLTESSISMIENEKISPSMTTVHKIAMALSVHPIEFFEIEKHKKWLVTRKGERRQLQFGSSDNILEYLIKNGSKNRNEIFISCLGPTQKSFNEPITHDGYKFGYVLTGSIELEMGNETVRLNTGDSIFFKAITPHLWKNLEAKEAKTLWVVTRE